MSTKTLLAFIAGTAAGAIITYSLCNRRGEEVMEDFKDLAQKVRDNITEQLNSLQSKKAAEEPDDALGI